MKKRGRKPNSEKVLESPAVEKAAEEAGSVSKFEYAESDKAVIERLNGTIKYLENSLAASKAMADSYKRMCIDLAVELRLSQMQPRG